MACESPMYCEDTGHREAGSGAFWEMSPQNRTNDSLASNRGQRSKKALSPKAALALMNLGNRITPMPHRPYPLRKNRDEPAKCENFVKFRAGTPPNAKKMSVKGEGVKDSRCEISNRRVPKCEKNVR